MNEGERLREVIAKNKAERDAFALRSQELQKIILTGSHDDLAEYTSRLEASFHQAHGQDGENLELDTTRGGS